eukprot:GHVP01047864.1.p1 GENE.GHVP01047864.1~~GHVP01047864.1.p1  ORF type:complete len:256 (+),score=53.37 GHVP01047864.1:72-839(+)
MATNRNSDSKEVDISATLKSITTNGKKKLHDSGNQLMGKIRKVDKRRIPQFIGIFLLGCLFVIIIQKVIQFFLFRYTNTESIPEDQLGKNNVLRGWVVHVGDGDGLRFYHARKLCLFRPKKKTLKLKTDTVSIRLAGVDAPEIAHFGKPAQSYGEEAKKWLEKELLGKWVRINPYKRDQYGRIVASVHYKRFIFNKNISVELVRNGLAEVYTAGGAVYGDFKERLLKEEKIAKKNRIGKWKQKNSKSPLDFKKGI